MSMLGAVVEPRSRRDEEHEVDVDHKSKALHADSTMNSCGGNPLSKHLVVAAHGRRGATPTTPCPPPPESYKLRLFLDPRS